MEKMDRSEHPIEVELTNNKPLSSIITTIPPPLRLGGGGSGDQGQTISRINSTASSVSEKEVRKENEVKALSTLVAGDIRYIYIYMGGNRGGGGGQYRGSS